MRLQRKFCRDYSHLRPVGVNGFFVPLIDKYNCRKSFQQFALVIGATCDNASFACATLNNNFFQDTHFNEVFFIGVLRKLCTIRYNTIRYNIIQYNPISFFQCSILQLVSLEKS